MTTDFPKTIPARDLTEFARSILVKVGFSPELAAIAADVVVEGDLRGIDSHGINHLVARARELLAGKIVVSAEPKLVKEFGVMAWYEGSQGYAPAQVPLILPHVADLASRFGIGAVFIRNTSHWGCPAYYSRWLASRGYYGIGSTVTNPGMPLWGSSARSVGNNPITIAAPRRGAEPIVLDMAMQQIAWGALKIAEEEKRMLPGPWGFDEDGNETSDPAVINRTGRVRPVGDHKGSGLAFMLEILTGVMSGGLTNSEVGAKTKQGEPAHYSHLFIAIQPDLVTGADGYFDKVDDLYKTAKAAPVAKGFDEVLLPGDRSNATLAKRRRDGVPTGRIRTTLETLSKEHGIPIPGVGSPITA